MSSLSFWRQWVVANAAGELVGLGGVFVAGVLLASSLGEPHGIAMLGGLWAVVIAWLLGMIPGTLDAFGDGSQAAAVEPPLPVLLGLAALMGAMLGLVLAAPQWWVL